MKSWCMAVLAWGLAVTMANSAEEPGFGDRVRAYLLENPEVILEALDVLAEKQAQAALVARLAPYPDMSSPKPRLGIGAADAPVKVVEFFDYRCAPCKAMHPELEALVADHPEIRVEMRHLPILSPGSERAARFALAVEQLEGKATYARVHKALWHLRGPLSTASFQKIAVSEAIDFGAVEAAMYSDAVEAVINRNKEIAIDLEILGTPAFVSKQAVVFGLQDTAELQRLWLSR